MAVGLISYMSSWWDDKLPGILHGLKAQFKKKSMQLLFAYRSVFFQSLDLLVC